MVGYKSHVDGCNASSSLSQTKRTPLCNITNTSANIQKFKPFTSEDLNGKFELFFCTCTFKWYLELDI